MNDAEPKPAAGEPEMPLWLSAAAKVEWHAIVPRLLNLGVLSKIDGKALAAYCHCYARWRQAEAEIDRRGLIIDETIYGKKGHKIGCKSKRNPAVAISSDALKLMKSFLIEFGMTPAARTRLHVEKTDQPEDPLEALLQRNYSNRDGKYEN